MVYSFYFLCFGTTWNESNSLWEDKGGEVRSLLLPRKYACRHFYLLSLRREKTIYCDNIMINLSCKVIACGIILSSVKLEKKVQHSENDIRISHDLLTTPPYLPPKTITFIPSGANTQKKEIIPYPKCGFGACLRCG